MEEMWKELSLASLDHHYSSSAAVAPAVSGLTLQFLATPHTPSRAETGNQTIVSQPQKKLPTTRPSGEPQTPSSSSSYGLTSAAAFCACSKRKGDPSGDQVANDQKKYRLMKNRESAARSRARKQAYTYELELEVANLMEENTKLRSQQAKLRAAAGREQNKNKYKYKLHRTLTAPF